VEEEKQKAEMGEIADVRTSLKIWDVPHELAKRFIGIAKGSYANKSWLLLQDLMAKADKYDSWMASGKIAEFERRLVRLEEFIDNIQIVNDEEEKPNEATAKEEEPKKPKTFGGA